MFTQSASMEFPRSYNFNQDLSSFETRVQTRPSFSSPGTWSRKAQWLGFILIIFILIVIALSIAVAILGVRVVNTSLLELKRPCLQSECVKVAGSILNKMDQSIDPCDDFYEFACGTWLKETSVPSTETSWSQFEILRKKLALQIKEILEEEVDEDKMPSSFLLAQEFYHSCVSPATPEDENNSNLLATIERLLGSSDSSILTNFTTILANLRREVNGNYIFSLYVDLDEKNTSQYGIYLNHPRFGLSPSFLRDPAENKWRNDYLNLIASVWKLVFATEDARAKIIANDIIRVERGLAMVTAIPGGRENRSAIYSALTLAEIRNLTQDERALDWDTFLREVFENAMTFGGQSESSGHKVYSSLGSRARQSPPRNFTSDSTIIVLNTNYFQRLGSVLNVDYNGRDIMNYLKWRLLLDLGMESSQGIRKVFNEYGKNSRGLLQPVPRWHICADTTNSVLGPAVSYRYLQKYFSKKYKDDAEILVGDLMVSFARILAQLDWLDEVTREMALKKVEKMKSFVGFPAWLSNITLVNEHYKTFGYLKSPRSHFLNYLQLLQWHVTKGLAKLFERKDPTGWILEPTDVNAYYTYADNSINLPAGILQPPFFKMPMQALNYGAIGSIIGHEMTHGFDDIGRQCDSDGNLDEWWDPGTLTSYMEKSKCFVEQYYNFTVDTLGSSWNVDGNITLSENIADNGGLRQAFEAYKLYTERSGVERSLPGLEAYTPQQLFFVSFAQIWCGVYTPKNLEEQLMLGPHSPVQFRVKGPLQNFKEFYDTWGCNSTRSKTKMYHEKPQVCRIW